MRSCILLLFGLSLFGISSTLCLGQSTIPSTQTKTLEGRPFALPHDLSGPTVLIIGFSRNSADQTTAWQKHLLTTLPHNTNVQVFDIGMFESVPSIMRGLVTRAIRHQVPDHLESHFLVVTDQESEWRLTARYDPRAPDAAYVLLVNPRGDVLWQTHEAYSPGALAQITTHAANVP